jgi:uncharacterized membrane protein YvbJ
MFFGKWRNQELVNKKVAQKLDAVDASLQSSFGNVKQDVEHVKQWITYLHQHQDQNKEAINNRAFELLSC